MKQAFLEDDDFFKSTRINEAGELVKAKNERGKRDGTGPYKDSFQKQNSPIGKRKAAGEECPEDKREKMKDEDEDKDETEEEEREKSSRPKRKLKKKKTGPGGHIPDGTGPYGRGNGPGKGKADGSGLNN